jgi:hypothetical protein
VNEAREDPVVLRATKGPGGTRHLEARLRPDGGLVVEGQDIGAAVDRIFGGREYEWTWTVEPGDVPAAVAVLGGRPGDDPLAVVAAWFAANGGRDPGSALRDAAVPVDFWSRVGD